MNIIETTIENLRPTTCPAGNMQANCITCEFYRQFLKPDKRVLRIELDILCTYEKEEE